MIGDLRTEYIDGMEVIFTPALRANVVGENGQVMEVEVGANGMTAEKIPNEVVDGYTDAMGSDTDGVIGIGEGDALVLLDRLAPTHPKTALDSPSFAAIFALQSGGEKLARCERFSVVPPRDRLLADRMSPDRVATFTEPGYPAAALSIYDGVGLFARLTETTGRRWGFPKVLEHQVTGFAGRDPREFPFATKSGTEVNLPEEAHYDQHPGTGTPVANRRFPPTPWGHYGMAGNLYEWMRELYPLRPEDGWDFFVVRSRPRQRMPVGEGEVGGPIFPASSGRISARRPKERLALAGSWGSQARHLRSLHDNPGYGVPDVRSEYYGLRGRVEPA